MLLAISCGKKNQYTITVKAEGGPDSTKTYPDVYGITGYPTLILVDPNGNGVKKIVGYQEEGGLRRLLGEYLK